MADLPAQVRTPTGAPVKRRWRYTRWGSVILSIDFIVGVPAGIAISLLPALSQASSSIATTLLISFGGALVAVAAVVVAVKTIFVSILSPDYMAALERVRGGLKAAAKPFVIVAWICVTGALCSFASALAWPAIPTHSWWLRWLAFAVPAAFTAWGLIGSAQLVSLGTFHLEQRASLMKAVRELRQRRDDSSRSA